MWADEQQPGKFRWLRCHAVSGLKLLRLLLPGMILILVSVGCAPEADPDASPQELGAAVAERAGCLACHTTDGRASTGPTWQGLFGSEVALDDGRTVIADDEYLERSIIDPMVEVVDGYQPVMPTGFGDRLNDEEIEALVEYIRSLS